MGNFGGHSGIQKYWQSSLQLSLHDASLFQNDHSMIANNVMQQKG